MPHEYKVFDLLMNEETDGKLAKLADEGWQVVAGVRPMALMLHRFTGNAQLGRCAACRFWKADETYSVCSRIPAASYIGSRDEGALVTVSDSNLEGDTDLRTRAEFGCTSWEKV
jgi:hypothetical protein